MTGVFIGFAIIAFVILVGYVVARAGVGGPHAGYVLNRIAFFVTNPALLFTVLAKADLHVVFSAYVAIAAISALVTAGLFVVLSRVVFVQPTPETTIGALASSYVNANNIGLPVAVYVLGNASYIAPVLVLQLIVFAPIALTVLDVTSRGSVSLKAILTGPVRNPMIIASLAGVIVAMTHLQLPQPLLQPFVLIGGAAVPLVLMAFGMSLRGAKPLRSRVNRGEIVIASALKSAFMPLTAFLVASLIFRMHGHELFAAVALAALPAAQNVYNFASRYERGEAIARDAVLLSTVLAIPSLTVIATLLA